MVFASTQLIAKAPRIINSFNNNHDSEVLLSWHQLFCQGRRMFSYEKTEMCAACEHRSLQSVQR